MPYPIAFEKTPVTRQASSSSGAPQTGPLHGAPIGISTNEPIARPTARPSTPLLVVATFEPIRMYPAQHADETSMNATPAGSPPISTPPSTNTPPTAHASAIAL